MYQILNVQAESDRNSANRNKNTVTHRGGSKSFQQYRQELVNLLNNKCKQFMLYDFKRIIIVCNNQLQEAETHGPVSYMDVFTRTHAVEHVNPDGTVSYT